MYCNNCGNELVDGAAFCNKCGTKVELEQNCKEKCENRKCCVCGNSNLRDDASIFYVDVQNNYKELCDKCDSQMKLLENNSQEAINYFKNALNNITDKDVRVHIHQMLFERNNNAEDERIVSYQNDVSRNSIWVKGLKFVAWLLFFSIIIIGLVLAVNADDEIGILIFLVSIPIAFFAVAGMMVYLDIAADIRSIKNELIKRK